MSAVLYYLYTLIYLGLLVYSLQVYRRTRRRAAILSWAILAGLFYDNLILSLGTLLEPGPLLEFLSYPRFYLHQLVLPWLVLVSFDLARMSGQRWAQSSRAGWASLALVLLILVAGALTRLVGLQLELEILDGVARYRAIGVSGPPLVSILSIGFTAVIGLLMWRRSGWPWLFLASLAVFIAEGAIRADFLRLVLGSGLEVVFMWTVLQTIQRAHRHSLQVILRPIPAGN